VIKSETDSVEGFFRASIEAAKMITQQVEEEVVGRHDTVYLSFEVPSIPATESKAS